MYCFGIVYIFAIVIKPNNNTKKEETMKKYVCKVCGYVYNPEFGDPDHGIQPGTAFEDIPDTWACPICCVTKEDFEPVD